MRIMIIGSFNGTNIGDNAILLTIINHIEKKYGKNCKIYIPTTSDYIERKFKGRENIIPINIRIRRLAIRFFSIQTLIATLKIDMIITTAGILFDYNSRKFIGSNFVVTLTPLLLFARLLNKRVVGFNVGIINMKTKGEWFLKKALQLHDILYLRDPSDSLILRELGVSTKYIDSADIVFSNRELVKDLTSKEGDNKKLTIGINLNKYSNIFTKDTKKVTIENFVKIIAENLDNIINKYNCDIHFFPTAKMDKGIHEEVIKYMTFKQKCKLIILNDVEDLLSKMNDVSLFIGMRMHSLIFATLLQKPVISINYSPKVNGLMKQLNLEKYSNNISNLTDMTLVDSVESILSNKTYYESLQKENLIKLEKEALKSIIEL